MKLDIVGALTWGFFSVILTVFVMDFVDTMGTLIGVSTRANLLDENGNEMPVKINGEPRNHQADEGCVLQLYEQEQVFEFSDVPCRPVPSLLRGFSAPVRLQTDLSDEQYYFLMGHDADPFNRWEAGQQMAIKIIMEQIGRFQKGHDLMLDDSFVNAIEKTLNDNVLDKALIAAAITLPSERYLAEFMDEIDPIAIHEVRWFLRCSIAERLKPLLLEQYERNSDEGEYRIDAAAIGQRSLKNSCLAYLMTLNDTDIISRCMQQFDQASNMTDVIAALACLADIEGKEKDTALHAFYDKWQNESLVVDKWFSLQATSRLPNTLDKVIALTEHPAFNLKNPNKVRALISSFCNANQARFHDKSGAGYQFLADYVLALDKLNPQIAARMSNAFSQWRRYDQDRQDKMKLQMSRIQGQQGLSRDVYEVISKSLSA